MHNSILRLSGGIGNQLSQYAFKRALELEHGISCIVDIGWYYGNHGSTKRSLEIQELLSLNGGWVNSSTLMERSVSRLKPFSRYIINTKLGAKYSNTPTEFMGLASIREDPNCDSKTYLGRYLLGSFTSFNLWKKYSEKITDEIEVGLFPKSEDCSNRNYKKISIHARQGDYRNDLKTRGFHGYCMPNYYINALDALALNSEATIVNIESDSKEFATELANEINNVFDFDVRISTRDSGKSVLRSLINSDYLIGSNSTLSWWAHALGNHSKSIFPNSWFVSSKELMNVNDFARDRLILINSELGSQ
jgi:hypothetical protein